LFDVKREKEGERGWSLRSSHVKNYSVTGRKGKTNKLAFVQLPAGVKRKAACAHATRWFEKKEGGASPTRDWFPISVRGKRKEVAWCSLSCAATRLDGRKKETKEWALLLASRCREEKKKGKEAARVKTFSNDEGENHFFFVGVSSKAPRGGNCTKS